MNANPGANQHAQRSAGATPRILVVEDNGPIAMALVDELEELGADILGPANSLEKGMRLVESELPSAAVLDVDLDGTKVYPLARYLRENDVRFVLLTGYDPQDLPEDLRDSSILTKPVCRDELKRLITSITLRSESRPGG